ESEPRWHVLWTRSNCERLVYEQLEAKGYELFLPTVGTWAKRRGVRYFCNRTLFPGYLFLRRGMDKRSYLEVCKSQGVVKMLGQRWDRLATVPDAEIEAIQKVMQAGLPRMPHAYLREGQAVRITEGPLANVEGILLKSKSDRGLLVLSIELLRQSVAVEVDSTRVVPA
ncbi:MAG: transcription termination/antitermination protein NusG, partial [Gammaproteobacteria bacterium]